MASLSETILPIKLSSWLWGATVALTTGALFLNELTQRLGLEIEWLDKPLHRVTIALVIFPLGLLALIANLLFYIKNLNKPNLKKEIETNLKKKLDQNKTDILVLLSNQDAQTSKQISTSLNITEQLALFHLNELVKSKIITNTLHMDGRSVKWRLNQNGRGYLVSNNLLKV